MQKQAFYKQVHVWSRKVLATVPIGQSGVSLLGKADTCPLEQQIHKR